MIVSSHGVLIENMDATQRIFGPLRPFSIAAKRAVATARHSHFGVILRKRSLSLPQEPRVRRMTSSIRLRAIAALAAPSPPPVASIFKPS
jgi:hypothetical protein